MSVEHWFCGWLVGLQNGDNLTSSARQVVVLEGGALVGSTPNKKDTQGLDMCGVMVALRQSVSGDEGRGGPCTTSPLLSRKGEN